MNPTPENCYQTRVKGLLDPKWAEWFDGFSITPLEGDSLLTGSVPDQAALHGILAKIRDLGLTLVFVQQENKMNPISETMRPFDLRRDLDGMTDLIEAAFAGELQNWGGDFREQMCLAKQTVPLLTVLSRLSANFQHVFDGFVCEAQGRIISMVNVQKTGFDIKRWMIGNVATHSDYQRRGLARKLVTRAIEHARAHGAEVVMLDVRTAAQPAYSLYRRLGFVHYDSATSLKLETLPKIAPLPLPGCGKGWLPCKGTSVRLNRLDHLIHPLHKRLKLTRRVLLDLLMVINRSAWKGIIDIAGIEMHVQVWGCIAVNFIIDFDRTGHRFQRPRVNLHLFH
jgi:ribosomal protein S18 acetylase RimI-like enzyme